MEHCYFRDYAMFLDKNQLSLLFIKEITYG